MDAPPLMPSLTPERSRELADLRRRAYGPDADIQRDPDALQRLHDLEALIQTRAPEHGDPEPTASDPTAAAGVTELSASPDSPAPAMKAGSSWRRIGWWVSMAAVGLVGVLAGLAIAAAGAPSPDVILKPAAEPRINQDDPWLQSVFGAMGVRTPAVEYEEFYSMQVLVATDDQGSSCLVVVRKSLWADVSCSPAGLTPVVDFVAYPGAVQPLEVTVPVGTIVRFELRDGVVEVTTREPAAVQAADQPPVTSANASRPSAA